MACFDQLSALHIESLLSFLVLVQVPRENAPHLKKIMSPQLMVNQCNVPCHQGCSHICRNTAPPLQFHRRSEEKKSQPSCQVNWETEAILTLAFFTSASTLCFTSSSMALISEVSASSAPMMRSRKPVFGLKLKIGLNWDSSLSPDWNEIKNQIEIKSQLRRCSRRNLWLDWNLDLIEI